MRSANCIKNYFYERYVSPRADIQIRDCIDSFLDYRDVQCTTVRMWYCWIVKIFSRRKRNTTSDPRSRASLYTASFAKYLNLIVI